MAYTYNDVTGVTGVQLVSENGVPVGVQTVNGFSSMVSGPFVKASLPTGTPGQVIYVLNATGMHVTGSLAFYDGNTSSWIDVTTGLAIV